MKKMRSLTPTWYIDGELEQEAVGKFVKWKMLPGSAIKSGSGLQDAIGIN